MAVRVEVSMVRPKLPTDVVVAGILRGENLAAERGLALSQDGVPFDQGTLAQSGSVEPATDIEEGALIVYDTPYAARLHEHPEYDFSKDSNPNAQGKWVEEAVLRGRAELGAIIGQEARRG